LTTFFYEVVKKPFTLCVYYSVINSKNHCIKTALEIKFLVNYFKECLEIIKKEEEEKEEEEKKKKTEEKNNINKNFDTQKNDKYDLDTKSNEILIDKENASSSRLGNNNNKKDNNSEKTVKIEQKLDIFKEEEIINLFDYDSFIKAINSKIDSNCIDLIFNINNLSKCKFKIERNKNKDDNCIKSIQKSSISLLKFKEIKSKSNSLSNLFNNNSDLIDSFMTSMFFSISAENDDIFKLLEFEYLESIVPEIIVNLANKCTINDFKTLNIFFEDDLDKFKIESGFIFKLIERIDDLMKLLKYEFVRCDTDKTYNRNNLITLIKCLSVILLYLNSTNKKLFHELEFKKKSIFKFLIDNSKNVLDYADDYRKKYQIIGFLELNQNDKFDFLKNLYKELIGVLVSLLKGIDKDNYDNYFNDVNFIEWFDKNIEIFNSINYDDENNLSSFMTQFIIFNNTFLNAYIDNYGNTKDYKEIKKPINKLNIYELIKNIKEIIYKMKEREKGNDFKREKDSEIYEILKSKYINMDNQFKSDNFNLCKELYLYCQNKINYFDIIIKDDSLEYKFVSELFESVEIVCEIPFNKEEPSNKTLRKIFFLKPINSFFLYNQDYEILENEHLDLSDHNLKITTIKKYIPKFIEIPNNRKELDIFFKCIIFKYLEYENRISTFCKYTSFLISLIINILIYIEIDIDSKNYTWKNYDIINLIYFFFLLLNFSLMIIANFILKNISILKETVITKYNILLFLSLLSSFIPLWYKDLMPVYSLNLCFTFISWNNTLDPLIKAISKKTFNFAYTGLLIVIISFIFSSISFFKSIDSFEDEENEKYYCDNFFECFLILLNHRVRGDGKWMDIEIDDKGDYNNRIIIYEWIYYLIINLILLNCINGIIVDAFHQYREENEEKKSNLVNYCYICNLSRNDLGFALKNHKENDHNKNHYIHFFMYLNDINQLDCSQNENFALNCYRTSKISNIIPEKKCIKLNKTKKN
jgi:hypothetical protein